MKLLFDCTSGARALLHGRSSSLCLCEDAPLPVCNAFSLGYVQALPPWSAPRLGSFCMYIRDRLCALGMPDCSMPLYDGHHMAGAERVRRQDTTRNAKRRPPPDRCTLSSTLPPFSACAEMCRARRCRSR